MIPEQKLIPQKQEMKDRRGRELEIAGKHSALLSPEKERSRPRYLEIKGLLDIHC